MKTPLDSNLGAVLGGLVLTLLLAWLARLLTG